MPSNVTADIYENDTLVYTLEIERIGNLPQLGFDEYTVKVNDSVISGTIVLHRNTDSLEMVGYAIEKIDGISEDIEEEEKLIEY